MKRFFIVLLLLVAFPTFGASPEARIETRLQPADTATVGSTIDLQVDLLVDTWFTAPPVLPALDIPGAVVTPPDGEAVHLNETRDGKTFFGMRYTYRITPQQAQRYAIPALDIQVQIGQADAPITLHSQPLGFVAKLPPGFPADSHVLVASHVSFSQDIVYSHQPLRVGDSITRQLNLRAEDAQAMLIPPPGLADIDGLKRYVQTPEVKSLDDGRGHFIGGSRTDTVSYVVEKPGQYTLPAIEIEWWDVNAGVKQTASVPAVPFQANAASVYQTPFSVTEDLRALGRTTQLHIARHWLAFAVLALLLLVLVSFIKPRLPAWIASCRRWHAARQQARLDSAGYAWKQARSQLALEPPQLGGLYLWVRRISGNTSLRQFSRHVPDTLAKPLLALLEFFYGTKNLERPDVEKVLATLHQEMHSQGKRHHAGSALKPLNPAVAGPVTRFGRHV